MSEAQAATAKFDASVLGDSDLSASEQRNLAMAKDSDPALQVTGQDQAPSMTMSFYNALDDSTRKALDAQAEASFESFMNSDDKINEFGKNAVEAVNGVVDQLLETQKNMRIPVIDDLLKQANRDLDGYSAKYKDTITEKRIPGVLKWLGNRKRDFNDMIYDRQNLVHKIEVIDGKIIGKREELKQSASYVKQLLIKNKESMNKMVGVLAALESIHIVARNHANDIKRQISLINPDNVHYNELQDRLSRMAEVSNAIEQQHANYMARLAIARATNSQVRNLMHTSSSVIRNLTMVHTHTVPIIKQTIVQIGYAETVKGASDAAESLKNANEHALGIMADFNAKVIPEMERKSQQPIVSAESISKLTDNAVAGNAGIVEAIRQGREARQALEKAVEASNAKIKESDLLRDEELVKALLDENRNDDKAVDDFDRIATSAYRG
jgi:uncharacterized protein YaaN involved in tellurite resistance